MNAVVEVVVNDVQESITSAADFRGPARGVMDVIVLKGHHVRGAGEVESPVMFSVAGCGVVGAAVDVDEGNCDALGRAVAEDYVLATYVRGCDVVNPD